MKIFKIILCLFLCSIVAMSCDKDDDDEIATAIYINADFNEELTALISEISVD